MKGRTTIEFADVVTGAKEIIESDNMVTNALSKYFTNLGMINNTPFNKSALESADAIHELLGGILLFDKELDEDKDNIIAPGGIGMTGNGAYGYAVNGEVTEFGSFNESESGWQSDGSYKFVYDFTTSQANGDIACVCLTSRSHGYTGEGNKTSAKRYTNGIGDMSYCGNYRTVSFEESLNYGYNRIFDASIDESTITLFDYYNLYQNSSHAEEFFGVTGKIILHKYRVPMTKFDLRTHLSKAILIEDIEIDVPEEFLNFVKNNYMTTTRTYYLHNTDAHYLVWDSHPNNENFDATISKMVLRIENDYSTKAYSLANQTGAILNNKEELIVSNKFVSIEKGTSNFYCINLENNADFKKLKNDMGFNTAFTQNYIRYSSKNKLTAKEVVFDLGDYAIYPVNYSPSESSNLSLGNLSDIPNFIFYGISTSNNANNFSILRSTNYLATINNLPQKITKTSDKTMKVTYTLTF